jgi:hypothetical protein
MQNFREFALWIKDNDYHIQEKISRKKLKKMIVIPNLTTPDRTSLILKYAYIKSTS